jgi:hypothetical protein
MMAFCRRYDLESSPEPYQHGTQNPKTLKRPKDFFKIPKPGSFLSFFPFRRDITGCFFLLQCPRDRATTTPPPSPPNPSTTGFMRSLSVPGGACDRKRASKWNYRTHFSIVHFLISHLHLRSQFVTHSCCGGIVASLSGITTASDPSCASAPLAAPFLRFERQSPSRNAPREQSLRSATHRNECCCGVYMPRRIWGSWVVRSTPFMGSNLPQNFGRYPPEF